MNLRALVELAALVSSHSPHLIETGRGVPLECVQRYWSCSRAQHRLWLARLIEFSAVLAYASSKRRAALKPRLASLLADVCAGDLVSRVWGAVLTAADHKSSEPCGGPIARSVALLHESVNYRALKLLATEGGIGEDETAALDRLRRQIERWTDVLVGHLVRRYGLDEFAIDADRARDFGAEQLRDSWGTAQSQVWDLYFVSLRSSLPDVPLPAGRLGDLRASIAEALLASFPEQAFLDSGVLKSVRLRRLLAGTARG